MSKIKLNLFDLKHKEDLININEFFKKNIKKWFNKDGSPNEEYFKKIVCPFCKDDNCKKVFGNKPDLKNHLGTCKKFKF